MFLLTGISGKKSSSEKKVEKKESKKSTKPPKKEGLFGDMASMIPKMDVDNDDGSNDENDWE